jgi:hypothetical protein
MSARGLRLGRFSIALTEARQTIAYPGRSRRDRVVGASASLSSLAIVCALAKETLATT